MKLHIKNMVCDRCIRVVGEEIEKIGVALSSIGLGYAVTAIEPNERQLSDIRKTLESSGFELLDDRKEVLIESVRKLVIEEIQQLKGNKPEGMNFSDYLSEKTGYEYSYLSSLFSGETGQTIEQYVIHQKIEKVKEWLSYNELSLSEMAWRLSYSSSAHLSNQFKKITGMTPGEYKKSNQARKALDKV